MSAEQIIRTGNVVAVLISGFGRSRAECSCGWEGRLRMLSGWSLVDAYGHAGRCVGCLPMQPVIIDERPIQSLWQRLTPWPVVVAMILLLIPAGLWLAPLGHADPGCEQIPWGFLGSQQRVICDGPLRPDGSWERERVIGVPAHYRNATSTCYSGSYSSNCTFYPAGWVDQQTVEDTTYVVFPDNVLPNEPGHLG